MITKPMFEYLERLFNTEALLPRVMLVLYNSVDHKVYNLPWVFYNVNRFAFSRCAIENCCCQF